MKIDMASSPSGNSGLLVSSLDALRINQQKAKRGLGASSTELVRRWFGWRAQLAAKLKIAVRRFSASVSRSFKVLKG